MYSFLKRLVQNVRYVLCALLVVGVMIGNVYAADLVFSPSSGSYSIGQSFTIYAIVSNNTESINAVSGQLRYSTDILTLTSISKTGSIINMWAEEPSFGGGSASFEGVILNPGFSASTGRVVALTFRAKSEGVGQVHFTSGSILANDGNATNVLRSLGSATYTVTVASEQDAPQPQADRSLAQSSTPNIQSESYPTEHDWYGTLQAKFSWDLPSSATAVRTLYNLQPNSTPSKVYEPAIASREFAVDEDGIYYMHVQFRDANGWGAVAHRKFQIDTRAPKVLSVKSVEGATTTNANPSFLITAEDTLSGVDHISIAVDDTAPVDHPIVSSNTYTLSNLKPGKHAIRIAAVDRAGNKTEGAAEIFIEKLNPPTIKEYTRHAETGGTVSVSGSTYPNKKVEIAFTNQDDETVFESTVSGANGEFTYTWPRKLVSGVYDMSARVVDNNGATSDFTDPRTVAIENIKLIRIGMFIMNWLSLALIIVLAGMLIIATFWYSLLQFSRFRRRIHHTMKEAEHTLKVNVAALRRDTEEFHTLLVKAEKKRELTKEEQSILKKFKKRLDVTEKEIEKKLEQIG